MGTVGPVFPGSEVKLGDGDEILIKGPGVMEGYHNLPEETAKTLTDDGWLRTGDKGELDADGFLRITGRIKELFKTSGGKYIAPPAIESKFKAICPYASQFVVFGNERNFVVALITLDPDALGRLGQGERRRRRLRRDRVLRRLPGDGRRGTSRSSTAGSTGGRPSRSGSCSTTTCPSSPASSPPR